MRAGRFCSVIGKCQMVLFTPLLHAYVDSSWLVFVGVNIAQKSPPLLRVAEQQLLHDKV